MIVLDLVQILVAAVRSKAMKEDMPIRLIVGDKWYDVGNPLGVDPRGWVEIYAEGKPQDVPLEPEVISEEDEE